VSAKLNPEICINNASSNSRLTAAGREATAAHTILRTVSRLFFFLFLPTFDDRTTELHLHAEKLTETVFELGTLSGVFFLCVCVCVCRFVLLYASPLMSNYRTTSEAPSPGLETETDTQIIKTETSSHLNMEVFWFFGFLIFYFPFSFNSFLYIDISFINLFFI
jgi:hypothetical protein